MHNKTKIEHERHKQWEVHKTMNLTTTEPPPNHGFHHEFGRKLNHITDNKPRQKSNEEPRPYIIYFNCMGERE